MKNFYATLWLITALLTLIGMPVASLAQIATGVSANFQNYECDLSGNDEGMPGCNVATFTATSRPIALINDSTKLTCGNGTYCGARTDPNQQAVLPIDAFGACAWVDNYTNSSLFVPFGSSNDWQDFLTNAPSNNKDPITTKKLIVLTHCALPNSVSAPDHSLAAVANITPPYGDCTIATVSTPDIYGRSPANPNNLPPSPYSSPPPSTWTAPAQSFTCHNGATTVTSNLQWVAGDSNNVGRNQLSWNQNFTYSPDIQFTVTDSTNPANTGTSITVAAGTTTVNLSWTTTGATSCLLVDGWNSNTEVNTSSSSSPVNLMPTGKTTYTLQCKNDVGTSTATVTVDAAATKPAQCGSYVFVGLLDGSGLTPSSNSPFCAVGTPNQTTFPISSAVSNGGTFYVPYQCSNGASTVSCSAIWAIQMAPAGAGAGGW